jgi:hypothetical protein
MATTAADNTMIEPLCPCNTAEVVELVRLASEALEQTKAPVQGGQTLVESAAGTICDGLNDIDSGVRLLIVELVEVTDIHAVKASPACRGRLKCVQYDEEFQSVTEAETKRIRRDGHKSQAILDKNEVTLVASIVLTNAEEAQGQLPHPIQLRDEIEKVAHISSSVEDEHQVQFLNALETTCQDAHDAGATMAAVGIRRLNEGSRTGLQFNGFWAHSEEDYLEQEARRHGIERCVRIDLRQHDEPR